VPHTKGIDYYIEKLGKLRKDKGAKEYPATVQHAAPHKPLLLLAVTELTPVLSFTPP